MTKDKTIILVAVALVAVGLLLGVVIFRGTPETSAPDVQDFSPSQTPNLSEGSTDGELQPEFKLDEAPVIEPSEATAPSGR